MSYKVLTIDVFDRQAKQLAKKHRSLKVDLMQLIENLEKDPTQGDYLGVDKTGNELYKVRMAITSKRKGKSGGARVITFVKIIETKVYLASIYDKGEKDSLSNKEIELLFNEIP